MFVLESYRRLIEYVLTRTTKMIKGIVVSSYKFLLGMHLININLNSTKMLLSSVVKLPKAFLNSYNSFIYIYIYIYINKYYLNITTLCHSSTCILFFTIPCLSKNVLFYYLSYGY